MVRLFKSNNPLILLFLPLVGFSLLFSLRLLSLSVEKILLIVLLFGVVLSTAIFLNKGLNKTILFGKPIYLSALCITFFSCIDLSSISMYPIVLANLFLCFGFLNLIKVKRQIPCKGIIFNSSCFILLASVTYPPYLIFILLPWMSHSIIKSFNIREFLMPLLAILLFYIYGWSFFRLVNTELLLEYYSLIFNEGTEPFNYFHLFIFSTLCVGLLFSLIVLLKLNSSATNRFKKLSWIISLFLFFSLLTSSYNLYSNKPIHGLLTVVVPASILMPFLLVHSKKTLLTELFFSSFFFLTLLLLYLK